MKIIRRYNQLDKDIQRGFALGNFDGVHIGHQKLIKTLVQGCKLKNLEPCIYTFVNHTLETITGKEIPPQITNMCTKQKIFESLGIELLYLERFNENLMSLSPEEFVKDILIDKLNCKIVAVGFDYSFGYKGQGNADTLREMAKVYGFEAHIIQPVTVNSKKVGSSIIREYIRNGNIEEANIFLGRPYSICSKVIRGKGIGGDRLGYPTANISIESCSLIPKEGIYATFVKINDSIYKGAACVGTSPTFGNYDIGMEVFIIGFNGDIYDRFIEIQFVKKLRDQIKFDSIDNLINQIERDVNSVNTYLHL
ncbi:MAG: bifunctional riboflavin kinase/FAD synthetase [Natronincolaceae bacterium]|jgi:riboflavin kinase/FMN adenylyltransferase|nr:bifunctional riboflavin kinase/FAD synthetase [Bacillota bacterium]NLK90796.1 bifunctional riboflavin kinase/FAD synthetase [Clostridiales bacterium]